MMRFSKKDMQAELLDFLMSLQRQFGSLLASNEDSQRADPSSVKGSTLWTALDEMYDYGVQGIATGTLGPGNRIDGAHAQAECFLRAIDTEPMQRFLHAVGNTPPRLAALTARSAVARTVLDGGERYTDFGTDRYGFGKGDSGYLTISEVAVLADMDERSVRNAANPKLPSHLKTEQIGNRSLVLPEEANRWLQNRKGFIPTKISAEFERQIVPEIDITLTEEQFNKLNSEAEIERQKTGKLPSIYITEKLREIMMRAMK